MISSKKAYKPDLTEFITQCEMNYWLILKLMPFLDNKRNSNGKPDEREVKQGIKIRSKTGYWVDFELVDSAKYTSTFVVKIQTPNKIEIDLLIRLYHDLELLEVMDKAGPKALKAVVSGDELAAKQTDEKRQLNRFLGECLRHCLREHSKL